MCELFIIATKLSICRRIGGCETLATYPINMPNPSHTDQANPTSDQHANSKIFVGRKMCMGHKMYR
jgi:hypothetical protein